MYEPPDKKTMFLARYGSEKHIDSIIDKNHPEDTRGVYKDGIMRNPLSTKEHLTKITPHASDLSDWGIIAYARHRNIPDHVKEYIMVHGEAQHKEELIHSPGFKKEDLDKHIKTAPHHSRIFREMLNHPAADETTYMHALDNPDYKSKIAVFDSKLNSKVKPSHIEKALKDENDMVRWAAIKHPAADIEELEHHAKNDPSELVRMTAIKNEYAPRSLIKHVHENDPDEGVRSVAKRLLEH